MGKGYTRKGDRPDKTFTFKSFNDHIAGVKINLIRRIDTAAGLDDEFESKFHVILQKFDDLNCTADFANLKKQLGGTHSFFNIIQVHERRDELANALIEALSVQDSAASDAALELIVALATDVGELFYPHFEATFNELIQLLATQDAKLIENIFMTLASLFKLLSKSMISDVEKIFSMFSQLFSNKWPDFIQSFAAQSLTYLIRKVTAKDEVIKSILDHVDKESSIVSGVSFLLFEVVKGVTGHLHSCADQYIRSLLVTYASNFSTSRNVRQCVDSAFKLIADHVDKERTQVIWTNLLTVCEDSIQSPQEFKPVASILLFFVSYKRGELIRDCEMIVSFTIASLQAMFDVQDCLDILLRLTAIILNSLYSSIDPESRRRLIKTTFDTNITATQFDTFIECLFNNRFFEVDILPLLLERSYHPLVQSSTSADQSDRSKEFNAMIEILFKLVSMKQPIPILETLRTFETYPLDFSSVTTDEGCENLLSKLLRVLINPEDWLLVRKVVYILPHLVPLDRNLVISGLISLIYKLMANLSDDSTLSIKSSKKPDEELLQIILSESIHSLSLLRSTELLTEFKVDFFSLLFERYPGNPIILQGFVFFYQYAILIDRKDIFSPEFFENLFFNYLQDNLRHPRSQVRFLTLIAINLFDPPLKPNESGQPNQSIFSICLESEMVALNIQEYREKLRLINLLQHGLVDKAIPCDALSGQKYTLVPIYYLLGTLYYNFQPLWQPVQKIIQDYGRLLQPQDRSAFWKIMSKHYNDIERYIRTQKKDETNAFWSRLNQSSEANPRPDYINHRILLLQILKEIASEKASLIESQSEQIVSWFFSFLTIEADSKGIGNFKREEDISLDQESDEKESEKKEKENEYEDEITDSNQDDMTEMELDKEETKTEKEEHEIPKADLKNTMKTMCAFLELTAKFKNPQKIDTNGKLMDLYETLLQQPNPVIQKASFNCLLTYNDPNVSLYRESLFRLLDDSTFKTEILLFGSQEIDPDQQHLKESHRSVVIPFVMRILYGKMLSKTGSKTAGMANIDTRRSIVFRFLASCKKDEVILFLRLAFVDFVPFFDMELPDIISTIKSIDIHKCIPLKYVQSALKTLELMLLHFGNTVTDILPILYKLLLVIASFSRILLDQRESLNVGAVNRLKTIRIDCFKLTEQFFRSFESYSFSSKEVDGLFETLIDPMIVNLPNESLFAPSPLLRLLRCWTHIPRFFILLVKTHHEQPTITPLSTVIDLYSSHKVVGTVVSYISAMLANLTSYTNYSPVDDEDPDEIGAPYLEINGVVDESYLEIYRTKSDEINLGTSILIPFISPILARIRTNLLNRLKSNKKRRESIIQEHEATILSYLSEQVKEEKDCLVMANLLIDTISYNDDKNEETSIKTLESINNLVDKVDKNGKMFIKKLCPLFTTIKYRNGRLGLCKILKTIGGKVPHLSEFVDIIVKINSYNPRIPDEPDYTVREEGYSQARKMIQEMDPQTSPVNLLKVLVQNCFFFISTAEDLGIREASSNCLTLIIKKLCSLENTELFDKIVRKSIFRTHVKNGMKEVDERARHEWITILSDLIKHGKDKDESLRQLSLLSHEDVDQDFWSNIVHIQMHRRVRALAKLSNNHALLSQIAPNLLYDYLLPIATVFITDLKETKYGAASAYAVDMIGSICRYIPWGLYQRLLRLYLQRIISDAENHKSNVRILCSILTNFNYDLSNSETFVRSKEEKHISRSILLLDDENEEIPRQILSPEVSTRIQETIVSDIVQKLQEVLYKLSYTDYEYDNIRSEFNHEDEIQRMPIALAIVKLLDAVPIAESEFENQVRSVFTRMSNFLKSRMESIRESSRKILCKIMEILGARYLPLLVNEMKAILNKGFRFHVLTFTLYIILESISKAMKPGDLDASALLLIEIFHKELFTDAAEEKSVGKITAKCKEAKKVKSYAAYRILGKFVSSKNLIRNMMPMKKILDEALSTKVIRKVTICMEKFFLGLTENTGLSEESLMKFIHDALEDKIPQLKVSPPKVTKKSDQPTKEDSLLLKSERNVKRSAKTNPLSNVHVLFEYCLRLLLSLFKRNRLRPETPCVEQLGNFVPILIDSLFSKHVKLTSTALRCLMQYVRTFPNLPEFEKSVEQIKNNVLSLLDEFVAQGTNSKENVELVTTCFKAISSLVRSIDSVQLNSDQLKVLLFYVDKDMVDRARQSTAFSLLKAILTKKLESPEIKGILQKLTYVMLQSDDDHIREECRLVWLKYLLNYSLGGEHFTNYVTFFTRQLEYPREIGRLSMLKLLLSLIKYQDNSQISEHAAAFYIPISVRLINDDSYKCRELAASVLEKLLSKISKKARDTLFTNVTLPWFQAANQLHRRLAAQLYGIFATVEGDAFRPRLPEVLPLLVQQLDPIRYPISEEDEDAKRNNDHQLFQLLSFFHKILLNDPEIISNSDFINQINSILFCIESSYLTYPHIWVRILSVKIVSSVFSNFSVTQVAEYLIKGESSSFYLFNNLPLRLWNLCKKHCFLFSMVYESSEIGDLLVKNLHYIARILLQLPKDFKIKAMEVSQNGDTQEPEAEPARRSPKKAKFESPRKKDKVTGKANESVAISGSINDQKNLDKLNIIWLTNRLIREIKREITKSPHEHQARISIFKWIAAIVVEADTEIIQSNCRNLLIPLAREITNRNLKEAGRQEEDHPKQILVNQCLQLYEMLRNKVGGEIFSKTYAEVVTLHNRKKSERKASQAVQFLINPVMAMRKKQKKHLAWKENKKRKRDFRKGKTNRVIKRPKLN